MEGEGDLTLLNYLHISSEFRQVEDSVLGTYW